MDKNEFINLLGDEIFTQVGCDGELLEDKKNQTYTCGV